MCKTANIKLFSFSGTIVRSEENKAPQVAFDGVDVQDGLEVPCPDFHQVAVHHMHRSQGDQITEKVVRMRNLAIPLLLLIIIIINIIITTIIFFIR